MRIEINATVQGRPAYCVIDAPEVVWHFSDATVQAPTNVLPDSIHRVDMVDDKRGKRATMKPAIDR
jgi:hypothetical protein